MRINKVNVPACITVRTVTSWLKKNTKSTEVSTQIKSEYEIELQRLIEKDQVIEMLLILLVFW